jgi:hypothetical protein
MEVKKSIIMALRLINFNLHTSNVWTAKKFLRGVLRKLNDAEKENLAKVLKAMVLMTSGSVKTIRNPDGYDKMDPDAINPWDDIMSYQVRVTLETADPDFDSHSKPTKEDYMLAKKLLPIMGSSFTTDQDIEDYAKDELASAQDDHQKELVKGFQTLYRGLKGVSIDLVKRIMTKKPYSIERAVSTSFDYDQASDFAGLGNGKDKASFNGPAVLLYITNLQRKGFVAGHLSAYDEDEVILSGMLNIEQWEIYVRGRVSDRKEDINGRLKFYGLRTHLTILSADKTITFKYSDGSTDTLRYTDEDEFAQNARAAISGGFPFTSTKVDMPNGKTKWIPNERSICIHAHATLK